MKSHHRPWLILVAFAAAAAGCRAAKPTFAMAPLPAGIQTQTIPWKGGDLNCTIAVPRDYDGRAAVPLILALHYSGKVAPFFAKDFVKELIEPGLRETGGIIVAPDSLSGDWTSSRNEEAVLALLNSVPLAYKIDPKKVVVTGFSMGGQGAWFFAGKYPERFSACIPIAGKPDSSGAWRVPVLAIHSQKDEVMPLAATQDRIAQLKKQALYAELVVLGEPTHYDVAAYVPALKGSVAWLQKVWKPRPTM